MLENALLVMRVVQRIGARVDTAMVVYRVENGVFNCVASLPVLMDIDVRHSLMDQGYKRTVAFNTDDNISGLYTKDS